MNIFNNNRCTTREIGVQKQGNRSGIGSDLAVISCDLIWQVRDRAE